MNVGELIRQLQNLNPDDEIFIYDYETSTAERIDEVVIRRVFVSGWNQIIEESNGKKRIKYHDEHWEYRLVIQ